MIAARRTVFRSALSALAQVLTLAAAPGAFAHGQPHAEAPAAPVAQAAAPAATPPATGGGTHDARAYFTDTELVDQHGRRLQFYSDVLKDRVVVLNVVYTNCKDACPLITRKLKEVRDALGEEAARKVHFISISSDPLNDTPASLKAFAAKNQADSPNWIFLTGDKAKVDFVLSRLGQLGTSVEEHSTLLIAGDVPNKRWNKIRPDAPPPAIAERLKLLTEPVAKVSLGK
ncbi:redoxin domain-containing protein [Aromatoleum toluvorans]|uniref:Redoxin domain-containing protein n=1 Tax=Aromatoleum toluvorans TaxID=92002 RepID=A0ABX1Q370_9RHOO|nr:SCO family protein [Aromatoleum toluvorans]NMG46159.1 redoxin domain-containing protein [Aromatoleum toluvorans]